MGTREVFFWGGNRGLFVWQTWISGAQELLRGNRLSELQDYILKDLDVSFEATALPSNCYLGVLPKNETWILLRADQTFVFQMLDLLDIFSAGQPNPLGVGVWWTGDGEDFKGRRAKPCPFGKPKKRLGNKQRKCKKQLPSYRPSGSATRPSRVPGQTGTGRDIARVRKERGFSRPPRWWLFEGF